MPLLTLVLVVRREQGFVRPCLRSVVDQAPECPVLVVDDAAGDHSAEIAAEEARAAASVTLHALPERLGPGPAHAAALEQVASEYVWFVDPTDLLPPGAVAAVEAQLEESAPDVLVVAHTLRDVYGKERPGPVPGQRPRPVLWDKVVRTSALRGVATELRSGPGGVAAAVAALEGSGVTVEVLPSPAYVRRDLPRAVRVRSGTAEPRRAGATAVTTSPARAARTPLRRVLGGVRHPRRLVRSLRTNPTQAWYRLQRRLPLDPNLVVYAAYWNAAYSCNPRAIYEKAREVRPLLRGVWVVEKDSVGKIPPGVEHVVAGTREYYRLMARATYFVNNVNFPNDIVKRPGQVHLQTHHGTPLKVMGMDLATSVFTGRKMNFPRLMKRIARWDYSISQNAFTSEQWDRAYPSGTYEHLETGYPRNDVLANATDEDVARIREALGIAPGVTTVMYMPTHREYHPGYVPQLDVDALAGALGPDHLLLMRAHYFYADETAATTASERVRNVADHPRIEDLYLASDVLVTDYSSSMFDYAVLDRPVVIYAPDWEEYRTLRGTTFDLMAEPPGAVALTEAELTEVLVSGRAWDDDSAARRAAFRARFCSLEDGRASERVVEALWPATAEGPG